MKYKTILIDPPWSYSDKLSPRHGRCPYPVMSMDSILRMPIPNLSDEGCHIYLWTTNSFLHDAFHLLKAWGYNYKTAITWFKPNYLGLGHYWRNNTEHCLFATYGKSQVLRKDIWNAIVAPKRNHSSKPIEFYGLVEEMSPQPRLEIFARSKREGWDVWGNEVESDIQL
jgi:N6-adenosine-specific RNA methylase IME4